MPNDRYLLVLSPPLVIFTGLYLILPPPPLLQAEAFVLGTLMLLLPLVTFKQSSFDIFLALPYISLETQIRIACHIEIIALYSSRMLFFYSYCSAFWTIILNMVMILSYYSSKIYFYCCSSWLGAKYLI